MEGNGPPNGTARLLGTIVLADNPVAADATCARLMGFEPDRIEHVRDGSIFMGNSSPALIDQVGQVLTPPITPFHVVPEFQYLRVTSRASLALQRTVPQWRTTTSRSRRLQVG